MPYTTKQTIDVTALPNSNYGAAGNTTSVPGLADIPGNTWKVTSGKTVDANNAGYGRLVYPQANPTLNQEIEIELAPGWGATGALIQIVLRQYDPGASNRQCVFFLPLAAVGSGANFVWVQESGVGAGALQQSNPSTISPDPAKAYRIRCRLERSGSNNVATVQIYNLTDATPYIWNSGSDSIQFTYASSQSNAGAAGFLAKGAQITKITYRDDQTPPELIAGQGEVTEIGYTSLTVEFEAANSGTEPITGTLHRGTDIYFTPGVGNLVAGGDCDSDGSLVFTDTGLDPDTVYCYKQSLTDALAQTAVSQPSTTACGAKTKLRDLPTPIIYQAGDSITGGGSPQSIETMGTELSVLLGTTVTTDGGHLDGGGITDYIDDDFTPLNALTENIDAAILLGATDFQVRIGINDTIDPEDWTERLQALVDYLRTRKGTDFPTLDRIWILTMTFRHGAPDNYVPDDVGHARLSGYRDGIRSVVEGDSGEDGVTVYTGDMDIYEFMSLNVDLLADGIHPTQAGYNFLGKRDAMWWYDTMTAEAGGGGADFNMSGGMTA